MASTQEGMRHDVRTQEESRGRVKIAWHSALCFLLLVFSSIFALPAGQRPTPNQINQLPHNPLDEPGFNDADPTVMARRMWVLNMERQKSIVSDTDRLLKLARELNSEIDKSNPEALTPVQLRKIGEIEKLARNVKQKMSISFAGGPTFQEPASQ